MVIRNDLCTAARLQTVRGALRARRFPAPGYAALVRLAQEQLGVSAVLVSLLDEERQHIIAGVGIPPAIVERGLRAQSTLCHHVLQTRAPLVLTDVAREWALRLNCERSGLAIRAFAGFPLTTSEGFVLGAFCAAHDAPRTWRATELELLARLADAAASELEVRAELAYREEEASGHDASIEHEGMLATAPAILASITDVFLALDREWRFTWANPAAVALFGAGGEDLVGRPAWAVLPAVMTEEVLPRLEEAIESGQPVAIEEPLALGERKFTLRAYPAHHGISVFLTDVTLRVESEAALRLSEDRLRQAQKMEAIGLLTGGVAHDFNNILTVIQANADVLAQDAQAVGQVLDEVAEIQRATERAARLTQQLLAFSRKQVLQPRVVDASRVASQLLPMLRRVIQPNIRIETIFEEELPCIRCDRTQLEQVVLNLALNARDAMPSGGTLRVATRHRELRVPFATTHAVVEPGSWVCVSVADTGVGIAPEVLMRVFEPFFTTKASGTGLGLGTVYGIVRQSGGVITVESTLGLGTVFTVWLPSVVERAEAPGVPVALPRASGQGTILVVDDESAVRTVLARALGTFGYSVLLAADGEEAIVKARRHHGKIDLVLSDVAMPGMNGVAVLERMRELCPGARQMLMSGFAESPDAHAALVRGEIAFLAKPFSIAQLGEAVSGALGGRRLQLAAG